jgi:hypothetical protein
VVHADGQPAFPVSSKPRSSQIVVFTLATGSATAWRLPTSGEVGSALSWTANGQTLAFQFSYHQGLFSQLRLLNAGASAGGLNSGTETIRWTVNGLAQNGIITPDGSEIVCVTGPQIAGDDVVTYYSVRTGKLVGFQRVKKAQIHDGLPSPVTAVSGVVWSSTTGSTLLVGTLTGVAVLTAGHITPIPYPEQWPQLPFDTAW